MRYLLYGACALALVATPVMAVTAKEKMKTCEFGAKEQKLAGKARSTFIKKCMANEPRRSAAPGKK